MEETALQKQASIMRGPYQIAWDITVRCNFRCLHCYNRSGENASIEKELTDQEALQLADQIAELRVKNVCFCGGEPLLRKDVIYKCVEKIIASGSKAAMVSNGYLLTPEIADNLRQAGLNMLQISIDGASAESHDKLRQKKGSFEKALQAIGIGKKAGFEVSVAFTPTKFNIDEVDKAARRCLSLGIKEFRLQPTMPLGRSQKYEDIIPSDIEYRRLLHTVHALKRRYNTATNKAIEWGDPIDHLIRFRTSMKSLFTFLHINADGTIPASSYMPLIIGNVRKHSLREYYDAGMISVWEQPYVQDIAKYYWSVNDLEAAELPIPRVHYQENIIWDLIDGKA